MQLRLKYLAWAASVVELIASAASNFEHPVSEATTLIWLMAAASVVELLLSSWPQRILLKANGVSSQLH